MLDADFSGVVFIAGGNPDHINPRRQVAAWDGAGGN
jgi:hypothetical protein